MLQSPKTASFEGYGLTTAEILYRIPDHRDFLQTFVWQEYDIAPRFPALKKFLAFWAARLEGPLHSVQIAHHRLLSPAEVRIASAEYGLN